MDIALSTWSNTSTLREVLLGSPGPEVGAVPSGAGSLFQGGSQQQTSVVAAPGAPATSDLGLWTHTPTSASTPMASSLRPCPHRPLLTKHQSVDEAPRLQHKPPTNDLCKDPVSTEATPQLPCTWLLRGPAAQVPPRVPCSALRPHAAPRRADPVSPPPGRELLGGHVAWAPRHAQSLARSPDKHRGMDG